MADFIDDAQAVNELHQEVSLQNQKARLLPDQQPNYAEWDGKTCVECGDDIPLQRVAWQRCRCTPCEDFLEKRKKLEKHNIKAESDV